MVINTLSINVCHGGASVNVNVFVKYMIMAIAITNLSLSQDSCKNTSQLLLRKILENMRNK